LSFSNRQSDVHNADCLSRHAWCTGEHRGAGEYSQLIWAVLLGATFYADYPNPAAIVGLVAIAAAGLATLATSRFAKDQS
jgi:hypothetical protein